MLPRRQSIFHLGEEGGIVSAAVHHRAVVGVSSASMAMGAGRRAHERERLVVGLQILVHHHHHGRHGHGHGHGHAHAHAANVVLKQMARPRAVAAAAGSRHGKVHGGHTAFSCSFLKACFLCKRELSPDKDVYMYRGDQGFCSEECRWQQILVDEAREREAAAAMSMQELQLQRRGQGQARHHSPHPTPIRGRPPPRKTLAVA